jgi:OH-DDVA oxygenase
MAEIVLGIGTSHTPLLTFGAEKWADYSRRDYKSKTLNLSDGRWVSYEELVAERGERYAKVATAEEFAKKQRACQEALDRIAEDIADAEPDVVLVVTDDHYELFRPSNNPAISIFYGKDILTWTAPPREGSDQWFGDMVETYAMDKTHSFPGMPDFAYELIERLVDQEFDIGVSNAVEDPKKNGFGHGIGFIAQRLFKGRTIPIIPVLLNTYYPPNAPKSARCVALGQALRRAIEASPAPLRVAVVASGGLSHFTVDEALDRGIVEALVKGDTAALAKVPSEALNSGSSEIRNWLVLGGAIAGRQNRWIEYQPLYRTPAGTGIGVGFGVWA